jgi:hypothetical protein
MSTCDRIEELRDYAFDELPASGRSSVEKHLATCAECATELDRLQLTTAALRILPEREIPQRIAFVSDKVFADRFAWFWNSAPRLGFASACVLAVAIFASAYRRPVVTVPAAAGVTKTDVTAQVNSAVALAVDQAVQQIRAEDARVTQAALAEAERKHEAEHRALLAAMDENLTYLQKRYGTMTMLASSDAARSGDGQ